MKKNVKCDKCNLVQVSSLHGAYWEEFSNNYEKKDREYWLCNGDNKNEMQKL